MTDEKEFQALLRVRIREYLNQENLSQKALADQIGCAPSTLNMFLAGRRGLEPHWIYRVCYVMGVDFASLENKRALATTLLLYQSRLETLYHFFRPGFEAVGSIIDTVVTLGTRTQQLPGTPNTNPFK